MHSAIFAPLKILYMNKWLIVIIAVLVAVASFQWHSNRNLREKWELAEANVKAYGNQLSSTSSKNSALQLTVDQLEYFKDSILIKLDETRKKLKIKDKELKSVEYITTTFYKTDTLVLKDTIFKDRTFALDTLLGDYWYNAHLSLKYPSKIAVTPKFKSEKHVIVSSKRETINPPSKFFLFRWFQKKHVVFHVDVIEKNPYSIGDTCRYVEIVK